ncbi:hypothetical protein L3Y34_000466 [Caenorhabditis briggsae]|uniref:Uncharacterized protein n=1 Tax=Caenorhabditis briggsae TaxID=6238 RepID=A0AAE9IMT1_CAEBR|nr:hypothetical protein L3Y34_000466 [Caenorhabditis briggsae]
MADELLKDSQQATTKELQNLWYITVDKKFYSDVCCISSSIPHDFLTPVDSRNDFNCQRIRTGWLQWRIQVFHSHNK